jgi:hypothetical protein
VSFHVFVIAPLCHISSDGKALLTTTTDSPLLNFITIRKCIGNSTKVIDLVEQDDEDIFNVHMEKLIRAVAAASMTPRGY